MNRYDFVARSPTKKKFKGSLKCLNEIELKRIINDLGYELIRFHLHHQKLNLEISNHISDKNLLILIDKWLMMIKAGVTLPKAVEISVESFHNKKICSILSKIAQDLKKGKSMGDILESFKDYFPSYFKMMMEVAERSGKTLNILLELSKYYRFQNSFKKEIKSALFYPIILSIFAFGIILVLAFYILPTFEGIFSDMGITLPIFTKIILGGGSFLRNNLHLIILGVTIIFLCFSLYSKTNKGKYHHDKRKVKTSLFKTINISMLISKFSFAFKILLESGMNSIDSLEVIKESIDNKYLNESLKFTILDVKRGDTIANGLSSIKIFPLMYTETIGVAESFGELPSTLGNLGEIYEDLARNNLKKLSTIIEPIFIIVISIIVVTVIASIYIPLFSLLDGITQI